LLLREFDIRFAHYNNTAFLSKAQTSAKLHNSIID